MFTLKTIDSITGSMQFHESASKPTIQKLIGDKKEKVLAEASGMEKKDLEGFKDSDIIYRAWLPTENRYVTDVVYFKNGFLMNRFGATLEKFLS